jgi:hypothetical protein
MLLLKISRYARNDTLLQTKKKTLRFFVKVPFFWEEMQPFCKIFLVFCSAFPTFSLACNFISILMPKMNKFIQILEKRKYELLLLALIQHLFIGIVLSDLPFYVKVIWPINMVILGFASVGVFVGKGRWKRIIKNILFLLALLCPLILPILGQFITFMPILNVIYVLFFALIFWEIMKFLVRPNYINIDVISAAACGYFLLLEIGVFALQGFHYINPNSFKGLDISNPAATYMDLVYFCSITLTSIGFGDILPNTHYTKLITSFLGIVGQFYLAVLVGILISKYSSTTEDTK